MSKAAVLFLLHDNMDRLDRNFAVVDDRMQRTFGEVLYCVYENDSTDGTAEWIRDLSARRNDVRLLSEQGYRPAMAEGRDSRWRYERMAACRNQCLDLARQHAPQADYAIALDIDFADFSQVDIAAAIREIDDLHPEWQALCGSGLSQRDLGVYGPSMRVVPTRGSVPVRLYDIAAMQTENDEQDALAAAGMAGSALDPPVRVRSAFGGIAIYKPRALYSLHYEGYDCEHVCLHRRMQEVFMSFKLCPMMVSL
ncbi:MAG TPA: hypothetical protein VNA69_17475 [Thermoanaerobaculia bacterium]|nr:hypothetical protein [Thermoanaerobaculia bacterium]